MFNDILSYKHPIMMWVGKSLATSEMNNTMATETEHEEKVL